MQPKKKGKRGKNKKIKSKTDNKLENVYLLKGLKIKMKKQKMKKGGSKSENSGRPVSFQERKAKTFAESGSGKRDRRGLTQREDSAAKQRGQGGKDNPSKVTKGACGSRRKKKKKVAKQLNPGGGGERGAERMRIETQQQKGKKE